MSWYEFMPLHYLQTVILLTNHSNEEKNKKTQTNKQTKTKKKKNFKFWKDLTSGLACLHKVVDWI